jgi:hypothetical protein
MKFRWGSILIHGTQGSQCVELERHHDIRLKSQKKENKTNIDLAVSPASNLYMARE